MTSYLLGRRVAWTPLNTRVTFTLAPTIPHSCYQIRLDKVRLFPLGEKEEEGRGKNQLGFSSSLPPNRTDPLTCGTHAWSGEDSPTVRGNCSSYYLPFMVKGCQKRLGHIDYWTRASGHRIGVQAPMFGPIRNDPVTNQALHHPSMAVAA